VAAGGPAEGAGMTCRRWRGRRGWQRVRPWRRPPGEDRGEEDDRPWKKEGTQGSPDQYVQIASH
jgi:hypothetical protein